MTHKPNSKAKCTFRRRWERGNCCSHRHNDHDPIPSPILVEEAHIAQAWERKKFPIVLWHFMWHPTSINLEWNALWGQRIDSRFTSCIITSQQNNNHLLNDTLLNWTPNGPHVTQNGFPPNILIDLQPTRWQSFWMEHIYSMWAQITHKNFIL
jgi:hypothetical protein